MQLTTSQTEPLVILLAATSLLLSEFLNRK
jgi:hypothetical protein